MVAEACMIGRSAGVAREPKAGQGYGQQLLTPASVRDR